MNKNITPQVMSEQLKHATSTDKEQTGEPITLPAISGKQKDH